MSLRATRLSEIEKSPNDENASPNDEKPSPNDENDPFSNPLMTKICIKNILFKK